jgi:hypothetical protein
MYAAGFKTVHACVPLGGHGNGYGSGEYHVIIAGSGGTWNPSYLYLPALDVLINSTMDAAKDFSWSYMTATTVTTITCANPNNSGIPFTGTYTTTTRWFPYFDVNPDGTLTQHSETVSSGPPVAIYGGSPPTTVFSTHWLLAGSQRIDTSIITGWFDGGANFAGGVDILGNVPGRLGFGDYTITTQYTVSERVSVGDLLNKAKAMLDQIQITNSGQRYWQFDVGNDVRLDWNKVTNSSRYDVYRAPVVAGVVGTYSRIALVGASNNTYIDTAPARGSTFSYYIQSLAGPGNSDCAPVQAVVNPAGSSITTPAASFVAGAPTATGAVTNLTATVLPVALSYTKISTALNANSQIILFATSAAPDFVISDNVACGTPMPFYLAGRALKYNESPLSCGVSAGPTSFDRPNGPGFIWSKSRGFLPGNSPNHVPPSTDYAQKLYYRPGALVGGGPIVDVSSLFPPTNFFPHGRSGNYAWQLSKELPSSIWPHPESFYPTDVPDFGSLIWPAASSVPPDGGGGGEL